MAALNFHHLRLFHAIAHAGSLTAAAARLHLSQSALSVQLQRLEAQLGHALFERQGRRLTLTEAGRIALDYADTVFQVGDELVSTLRGRPASDRAVLRVGALTTLSRNFQLAFLRPVLARPDVALVLRSGTARELAEQLVSHALDVVLANAPMARDGRADLHSHLLSAQPVSLVGPPRPDAPAFRFPHDVADQALLLPSRDSGIRAEFDRLLALADIRPAIRAEVDDMAMLRLLARETGALALVPPIVVRDELEAGLLVENHRLSDLRETFYAITLARRFPHPLLGGLLAAEPA